MFFFCPGKSALTHSFSWLALTIFLTVFFNGDFAGAQSAPDRANPLFVQPRDRVTSYVNDEQRLTIIGNRHPLATSQYDAGAVSPEYRMDRMILTLKPDPAQEESLNQLIEAQHNPESPYYHRWLTPEQYSESYGVSDADVAQITDWLEQYGMEVEEITGGHRSIIFSGTAAQVQSAFHTEIHTYKIGKEVHHANASDPQIPAALAGVVGGVVSLHDFRSAPQNSGARLPTPEFTSGSSYYLSPGDFVTIYDLAPAYEQSINGSGQSIGVVARSNINLSDVTQFRSAFRLPANNPQVIVNGNDPGIVSSAEETEADLDAEWSGAVARDATIKFVVSKSTSSTDGTYLSAQYIVTHNLAPVLTMSFGICEASLGTSGNSFISNLWQQAAAEGITALVSAGDNGAAGCDSASSSPATHGRAVNGLCSTAFAVCVGGSEFNDKARPSLYWTASNNGGQSSALSYIPEMAWNESSSNGLWATSGGASMLHNKPSWQSAAGVPSDGKRDIPDVSLTAAGHDGYLLYQNGGMYVVGGTSAAAPSFAGLMALVVQSEAARQGNANTVFYPLAVKQAAGGASVFHDITSGNNNVPGQTGFNAGAGFDQATGLGSVDASQLIAHWNDAAAAPPPFKVTPSSNTLAVTAGSTINLILSVSTSGSFNAPVAFSLSGLPAGVSAAFNPETLAAPGTGSSMIRFSASSATKAGTYSFTVSASSGTQKQQIPISITCSSAHNMVNR
jgi:pseudomonalisin